METTDSPDPGGLLAAVTAAQAVQATLYCRPSTTTASAIDRYHRRLQTLRSQGVVDEIDVQEWSTRVDLDGRPETPTARTYEQLTDWAASVGVALDPAFTVRTTTSTFTGETHRYVVTPVACLTLSAAEDDLLAVYPHAVEDDVYTLEDGLDMLAVAVGGRPVDYLAGQTPIESEE